MPNVKIELAEGYEKNTLFRIRDLVLDSVIEALKLPLDDRNIRIIEYKAGMFQMKPPYEILIEITMFSGRSKEAKRRLYKFIVDKLYDSLGIDKNKIFIVVNEQPMENWGVRGGIPADETQMDFKVNI
jgi:phenylpyruvate tautomerase PptA (4-oxalocrotonate tautomerase family)